MEVVLFALYAGKSHFLALYGVVLFCSLWKSYLSLCLEVVLFCFVWKSYFFALYRNRTFLLSPNSYVFVSLWTRTFGSLLNSYFIALYGSRTIFRDVGSPKIIVITIVVAVVIRVKNYEGKSTTGFPPCGDEEKLCLIVSVLRACRLICFAGKACNMNVKEISLKK